MKHYFLLISGLLIIALSSCRKGINTDTQAAIDDAKIQAYIKANNLSMTKDPSGIYYQIIQTNPGAHPTLTDTVQVTYNGTLLNGTSFDAENVTNFPLSDLVKGAQDGLLLIGSNGKAPYARIKIIVPSALGYGNSTSTGGSTTIPPNSVLVFTFDLIGYYQ
jgi:FKBP-type peptidyl-prolyl cis-trans isomerase FkpA